MTDFKHGDVIWAEVLGHDNLFQIRTVEGFANRYGGDADEMVAENIRTGRPLAYAFAMDVEPGYQAALIRQQQGAKEVAIGDVVTVEGRKYEIHHNPDGIGDELQLAPWTDPQQGSAEIIES